MIRQQILSSEKFCSKLKNRVQCCFLQTFTKTRVHELIRIWHYVKEIQIQVQPKLVILDFLYCSWKPDMFVIHYLNVLQKWGPHLCLWIWKSSYTIGAHLSINWLVLPLFIAMDHVISVTLVHYIVTGRRFFWKLCISVIMFVW